MYHSDASRLALTPGERAQLSAALGYTAEVCPPNGTPATEYITDRWGQGARARIFAAVELILSERTRPDDAQPPPPRPGYGGYGVID